MYRMAPRELTTQPAGSGASDTQTVTFSLMASASSIRARARSRSGADHTPVSGSRVYGQKGS